MRYIQYISRVHHTEYKTVDNGVLLQIIHTFSSLSWIVIIIPRTVVFVMQTQIIKSDLVSKIINGF